MSEFKDPVYQDYIAHYGVLGMHWGVRRYQNSDGSLTDKGKLRFKKVSENSKLQEKQSKKAKKYFQKRAGDFQRASTFYKNHEYTPLSNTLQAVSDLLLSHYNEVVVGSLKPGTDFITGLRGEVVFKDKDRANKVLSNTGKELKLTMASYLPVSEYIQPSDRHPDNRASRWNDPIK